MWYTHTERHTHTHTGILFNLKNQENPVIYDKMNEHGKHYAKWNKPGRERQKLFTITYM